MGRHGEMAREALLDSAEELFARQGIDAVSNRQIAEHAGSANHSAIGYHFGSRDDLLRALLKRDEDAMATRRSELEAELDANPTIHDVVRCRLLPFIEILDAASRPSWRAQFLAQMRAMPSATSMIADVVSELGLRTSFTTLSTRAEGVPESITLARSAIVAHLVLGVCADYEARVNEGRSHGTWRDVGYFLIDSTAGMLSAPVTGDYTVTPPREMTDLI